MEKENIFACNNSIITLVIGFRLLVWPINGRCFSLFEVAFNGSIYSRSRDMITPVCSFVSV